MRFNFSEKSFAVLFTLCILLVLSGCIQSQKELELKQKVLSKPVVDFKELPALKSEASSAKIVQGILVQSIESSAGIQAAIDKSPSVQPVEKPELKEPPKKTEAIGGQEIPEEQASKELLSQNLSKIAGLLSDNSGLSVPKPFTVKQVGEPKAGNAKSFDISSINPWPAFQSLESLNPQKLYSVVGTGCHGVKKTEGVPLFDKPQRINVLIYFSGGEKTIRYGIDVDPSREQPLVLQPNGFENPSINVYSTSETAERIFASQDPLGQLAAELSNEQILIEGANFQASIEIALAKGGLQALSGRTDGFVEEKDCEEIRQKWMELKKASASLDCGKIQAELQAAVQRQKSAEEVLKVTESELAKANQELEKARKGLQDFLKSGLQGNDYKFEPPLDLEKWNSISYPRHGTSVWFKGNGQKMNDFMKNFDKDIKALKEEIETAIKKTEIVEKLQKAQELDLAEATSEVEGLAEKLAECEKEKGEFERQIEELEKLQRKCLEKIAEQAQVIQAAEGLSRTAVIVQAENSETAVLIENFEELDRQILQDPRSSTNKDCEKVKELQEAARKALENAKSKEQTAKYHYEESKIALESGNIEAAKIHLEDSFSFLEEAKQLSLEAKEKALAALREKRDCLSSLRQQSISAAEIAERAKKWKKALESDNNSGLKPVELNKDQIRRGMDWALQAAIIEEITKGKPCDCPLKALIAADYLVRNVYLDVIYKFGLDIIKAPIDALTPEGLAGQVAQKLASYTLTYLGSEGLSDAAIDILTGELVGKILPGTDIDIIDKPAQDLTASSIADLLKNSSVTFTTFESNQEINSTSCGQYSCNVKVVVFYNPNTHYLIALIRSGCCPGTIMLIYETDDEGFPEGSPEVTILN